MTDTSQQILQALAVAGAQSARKAGEELAPAPVYLLADHLDAILAAGEDLTQWCLYWDMGAGVSPAETHLARKDVRDAVESIRALENSIIVHALRCRDGVRDVQRIDPRFRPLALLFLAGTEALIDAIEECGDASAVDFDTGDAIPAYLRGRGLLAPDATGPDDGDTIAVSEDFLIARRIAAGPLLDLAATLLDALELYYDLFPYGPELADGSPTSAAADDTAEATRPDVSSLEAPAPSLADESELESEEQVATPDPQQEPTSGVAANDGSGGNSTGTTEQADVGPAAIEPKPDPDAERPASDGKAPQENSQPAEAVPEIKDSASGAANETPAPAKKPPAASPEAKGARAKPAKRGGRRRRSKKPAAGATPKDPPETEGAAQGSLQSRIDALAETAGTKAASGDESEL